MLLCRPRRNWNNLWKKLHYYPWIGIISIATTTALSSTTSASAFCLLLPPQSFGSYHSWTSQRVSNQPFFFQRKATTFAASMSTSTVSTGTSSDAPKEEEQDRLIYQSSSSPTDDTDSIPLQVYHLPYTVDSTQEQAKRLLLKQGNNSNNNNWSALAVLADGQTNGRGTSGRQWQASPGNLYLTVALPMDAISLKQPTLLPLGVGLVVAQQLAQYSKVKPTVKWPNDVLLEDGKIAGALIESVRLESNDNNSNEYYWLIGIGVNLAHAPELKAEETTIAPPRPATCLQAHLCDPNNPPSHVDFGSDLAQALVKWVSHNLSSTSSSSTNTSSTSIIEEWKSWAAPTTTYTLRDTGETVTLVGIQPDGQLKVRGQDGMERLLVADYFY